MLAAILLNLPVPGGGSNEEYAYRFGRTPKKRTSARAEAQSHPASGAVSPASALPTGEDVVGASSSPTNIIDIFSRIERVDTSTDDSMALVLLLAA